jgi:hypothetical protein
MRNTSIKINYIKSVSGQSENILQRIVRRPDKILSRLRTVFHKSDEACMAHLHPGLLTYWGVNTVRHQLRAAGINSQWREIVRVMNTQKCVTTIMTNNKQERISIRSCSKPNSKVVYIYDILKLKYAPFIRKKSVVLHSHFFKFRNLDDLDNTS